MQEKGYFEKHPYFKELTTASREAVGAIEYFVKLEPHHKVVVVGCGYGRETLQIAPLVAHVYGIDVSDTILRKARKITKAKGIHNFTLILADTYKDGVPEDIDIVYSIVVMQHLTRDLVHDYFCTLEKKLAPTGKMVVQFLEKMTDIYYDADIRVYEPQVTWTKEQMFALAEECNLTLQIRTITINKDVLHHWGCFARSG
jgi:cyclopropane fatty-acyl-phospholipid synthase-like methyltransferase